MSLSPPARVAVQAAAEYLQDPEHAASVHSLGHLLISCMPREQLQGRYKVVPEVRAALGLPPEKLGALHDWASARSASAVVDALKALLTQ